MANDTKRTVGVDVGDRFSNYCVLNGTGEVMKRARVRTTPDAFAFEFPPKPRLRIALEAGTHSPWASRTLQRAGHQVIVADPRQLALISQSHKKNDAEDCEILARLARIDPELLSPIEHRSAEAHADLTTVRARDGVVAARTKLINMVRGQIKSNGGRMPSGSAESFHKRAPEAIPDAVRSALQPVVDQIRSLTDTIRQYDRMIEELAKGKYPETQRLSQVQGVGSLTALAYLLTLARPERFAKSRDVGAYLGLVPKQHASGDSDPQLRISKRGNELVRRLLVGSAHYILGPFGKPCDLRNWGAALSARGGKNGKKRAVVAVARRLAVLLHKLWVTGAKYDPHHAATQAQKPAAEKRTAIVPTS